MPKSPKSLNPRLAPQERMASVLNLTCLAHCSLSVAGGGGGGRVLGSRASLLKVQRFRVQRRCV